MLNDSFISASLSLKPSEISEYQNINNIIYKIRVQSYDERPKSASSSQGSSGSLGSLSASTEQEAYALDSWGNSNSFKKVYTGGSEYVTYDRSLDVLGLSKYTVKVKKSKKSPEPTIYAKDVFSHTFEYTIPKEKIRSKWQILSMCLSLHSPLLHLKLPLSHRRTDKVLAFGVIYVI